jgi:hypothetical protein
MPQAAQTGIFIVNDELRVSGRGQSDRRGDSGDPGPNDGNGVVARDGTEGRRRMISIIPMVLTIGMTIGMISIGTAVHVAVR